MKKEQRERESENEEMKSQGNKRRMLFHQADSRLLALSSSIIIEILTRTQLQDILNCRSVCKHLRELISDAPYVNVFISRTRFLSILHRSRDRKYGVKLLGHNHNIGSSHFVNTSFIPKPNSALEIIGCSNGLICLWNKNPTNDSNFYITNPVLGEFTLQPNPKNDESAALEEFYGFCSYHNPCKYKIIKVKARGGYFRITEVWVLGVGSGEWKYVGRAPFPRRGRSCLVFLNGCCHWIVDEEERKGPMRLHSLDIEKEQAHPFPAPFGLSLKTWGQELGVLGESLCIFDTSGSPHLEIWRMREYGVATSWTKDFVLTTPIPYTLERPFAAEQNGMILMSDFYGVIFRYDPNEGKFTVVYKCPGEYMADVMLFTPTFLSLKHVVSGDFLTVRKVYSYN